MFRYITEDSEGTVKRVIFLIDHGTTRKIFTFLAWYEARASALESARKRFEERSTCVQRCKEENGNKISMVADY